MHETKTSKVQKIMALLHCSFEEACEIIADDEAIDKGEKLFELDENQKKVAKEMTKTTAKDKKTIKTPRKRTENAEKRMIIDEIFTVLEKIAENVDKKNVEREISFTIGEKKYSITLTQHRK